MESSRGSAARVGFVVFIAMVVVIVAVYVIGDGGGIFREYSQYFSYFPSTEGLRTNAKVLLNGVEVGKVEEIGFPKDIDQTSILVTLSVQTKVTNRIREDSLAWIKAQNFLGDKEVHITVGSPSKAKLPPGSTIRGTDRSAIVDIVGPAMASSTSELLENFMTLLRELNAGKGSVGQFLKN